MIGKISQDIIDLKNDYNNLRHGDRFFNSKFFLSTIRVLLFVSTIGFAALAGASLLSASAPGVIGFGLLAIISHDIYQIGNNMYNNDFDISNNPRFEKTLNQFEDLQAEKNGEKFASMKEKLQVRSLTENTIIVRHLNNLYAAFITA